MSTPQPDDVPGVGVLMLVAYRAMEARVFAGVRAAGFEGSLAQGRIFARIGPAGTRLTELAESAQVTKQTAGFLVDQLESMGYVERRPDPADARARLITITDRGHVAHAAGRRLELEIEAEWRAHLGTEAMAQLHTTLLRLREITDPFG